jgi:hypothetical protein
MGRAGSAYLIFGMLLAASGIAPDSLMSQTTFTFGGYVKFDALSTHFYDGTVANTSVLRDIHFPGAIPVGGESDVFATLDYHAKESRFSLGTATELDNGKHLRSFFELDFLLAGQGDERVSNSYNPRLRHAYFAYGGLLMGQTWTTFQILDIPDDLDFAGAAEGIIFNRQPQVRYSTGNWQFAIESSETTLTPYLESGRQGSGNALFPDLVARYNVRWDRGNLSVAGILRQLNHEYDEDGTIRNESAPGYGGTFGGKLLVGERDDIRFQVSGGMGLGRYAALNFVNGAQIRDDRTIEAIPSALGFVGYRHFWSERWRSSANVSAFRADHDTSIVSDEVNRSAWSASVNLIYSPIPELHFGFELMRGTRKLENDVEGVFDRFQFSGRYDFRFSATSG